MPEQYIVRSGHVHEFSVDVGHVDWVLIIRSPTKADDQHLSKWLPIFDGIVKKSNHLLRSRCGVFFPDNLKISFK
jgi:hypothetical protein